MPLPPPIKNVNKQICLLKVKSDYKVEIETSVIYDCEVTRNASTSGTDCWGNPFTVRASCTVSTTDCTSANDQAAACAFTKAQLTAMLIYDECS